MPEVSDNDIFGSAKDLLVARGILSKAEGKKFLSEHQCIKIDSDGSSRKFWRFSLGAAFRCLIAAPAGRSVAELAESRAAWEIGRHLFRKGVPVPELYGWDSSSGVLLFEDLGDSRLHDIVAGGKDGQLSGHEVMSTCYHSALKNLVLMQCLGAEGFEESWCWDSSRYDVRLMEEKESGYFLRAFWQGLLGNEVDLNVWEELQEIARLAGEAPDYYFLHRDFQSRNIMIQDGVAHFIDFQGGRLGPLAYDLASLLIDPYSNLPLSFQEELVDKYLQFLSRHQKINDADFRKQFMLLAFQRNMQILGAFSFLFKVKQKLFFANYIKPSLLALNRRLADPLFEDYPIIRGMVDRGLKELVL